MTYQILPYSAVASRLVFAVKQTAQSAESLRFAHRLYVKVAIDQELQAIRLRMDDGLAIKDTNESF